MHTEYFDLDGQKKRREALYQLFTDYTVDNYDQAGKWKGEPGYNIKEWTAWLRERLWCALAYFGAGTKKSIDTANRIIKSSDYYYDEFSPMSAIQLLLKYDDMMDDDAGGLLLKYLGDTIDKSMADDKDFVGVNDNYPCMSTLTVLLGGRILKRPDVYNKGVERIKHLKSLLTRRGIASEYNSNTYTPVQICAMAEIANYIEDENIKKTALQCEERLWADVLGHYHPGTCQVAGPYSRAYTVDSAGHTHGARALLYSLLGDKLKVNQMNTLFSSREGEKGEVIHGTPAYMMFFAVWLASAGYHCPCYLVDAMLDKKYPYTFKATTEYGSSRDGTSGEKAGMDNDDIYEYAAGWGNISTFMTEDYALGVASNVFHSGTSANTFHLLYRRRRPVECQADIAAVYSKYIINEKKPGQPNYYPQFDRNIKNLLLMDEGRKLGVGHENTAMMLYKPKLYGSKGVTSLKLSIILPAHYGTVEEIRLGDRRLDGYAGQSIQPCPIFIKDGPVYIALHPLILTDHGRNTAIKIEQANGYVMVSLYNYEGQERDFREKEFLLTGNGFVAEVRSDREVGSFDEFMDIMKNAGINDTLFTCVHERWTYLRRTKYERDGLCIESEYSPVSEGVKYTAVNGKAPESPVLMATGLDVERLPFIRD